MENKKLRLNEFHHVIFFIIRSVAVTDNIDRSAALDLKAKPGRVFLILLRMERNLYGVRMVEMRVFVGRSMLKRKGQDLAG